MTSQSFGHLLAKTCFSLVFRLKKGSVQGYDLKSLVAKVVRQDQQFINELKWNV